MALTHTAALQLPLPVWLITGIRPALPSASHKAFPALPQMLVDLYYGGRYQLTGDLAIDDTPTDIPVQRRVYLMPEPYTKVIASAWADPVTGAWAFYNLSGAYKYTVLATDYQHTYRAVVADNLTPDPMS